MGWFEMMTMEGDLRRGPLALDSSTLERKEYNGRTDSTTNSNDRYPTDHI